MKIKKFKAPNIRTAMEQVKSELGEEAVILHSKSVSGKGVRGLLRASQVEVTAALQEGSPAPSAGGERIMPRAKAPTVTASEVVEAMTRMEDQIAELRARVTDLSQKAWGLPVDKMPLEWISSYRLLRERGLDHPATLEIISLASEKARDQSSGGRAEALKVALEERFSVTGPIRIPEQGRKVVVLIGATGVGKTTTLAKLAAQFYQAGTELAFVTADTYRLAAVDQLKRFAEILEVPLEVVYRPEEFSDAVRRQAGARLILVDTPGCSQANAGQMNQLAELLNMIPEAEIHLVLSVTTEPKTQLDQIQRFGSLGAGRVVLTKLDELAHGPSLLDIARMARLPISYLTNGQEVPRDISVADPAKLARQVLSRRTDVRKEGMAYAPGC